MSDQVIVMVVDREDSKHGEISVLDDAEKAERLVETLLEAGFDANRIRVFTGRANEFAISHRPVVALVGDEEAGEGRRPEPVKARASVAKEPPASEPIAEREQAIGVGAETAKAELEGEAVEDEAPVTAEAGAPVRFSSLFRSA